MSPALIAVLPFLGALVAAGLGRFGRNATTLGAMLATGLALVGLISHAPAILAGQGISASFNWLPAAGLTASFRIDGLALLFAGLILGIGLLILLYARFYLNPQENFPRFIASLMAFQGAMIGIVLSDNILLLLIFWELTSLTSFLLIGWWSNLAAGRQGARMALAVTGGGGLALIAGMLILGQIAGSYELSQILTQGALIQSSPLYPVALVLILLGAFTKSAQFPFHFWLPHAMAAPTPVSAYLHSATMVKAGIYLMARLWPALAGTPEWTTIVATAGLITMFLGAVIALFKDDLKAILAYSTVSHLGLITFLLGLGTKAAATAALLHILVHASFKAALFMLAGIVDHATHTRDIRALGGLRHLMPLTFGLAAVTALSMAGIPPLNGFVSKEAMLENAATGGLAMALIATLAALFSVAYSLRLLAGTFLGPKPHDSHAHDPGPGLWLAPALLTALVIASGLMPMLVFGPLVDAAASATTQEAIHSHLALWHGLQTPALWMSLAALGGGYALYAATPRLRRIWDSTPRPEAKPIFEAIINAIAKAAQRLTEALHNGRLSRSLFAAVATILALGLYAFTTGTHAPGLRESLPLQAAPIIGWLILSAAALATVRNHHNRVLALLLTGIVGIMISAAFAWASAPDLALTQITVEVATILLMLLALNFLPAETPRDSRPLRRARDAILATAAGLGTGILSYALMLRDPAFPRISDFHWAQSKPGAGGTNAVNTIIVDFRGYDTYGEIIVLGVAALVIFALAASVLSSKTAITRLRGLKLAKNAGDPHPLMLVVASRFLMPLIILVGVFIFLRGHNLPGGGFVAGLTVSIAILLVYIASGFVWAEKRLRFAHQSMIGAGVLIATATGLVAWAMGWPFLTSGYRYLELWPLDKIELTTAALFDLGVFLCVFGAVMLALSTLSRLAQHTADREKPKA
ncbi:monovalent cation/H+ antiporter subunit A [Xinfangfangia sp. CPCC 101601]|uniref:Monovalent cation/H+ antiporter subunit A n=1 Tax=Pseudogemmobacter lacusdianii TaxID=3069608 RepID=A0ABU0VW69_9RHOB|nr:monovalent cation/H+ antiporter subunit A [Xinfangfangia sp. CPCC 101601]MDQ2065989.1 monovalent cation/H+ antiporter subunit A [Xinfangfangia sp. CPCC 101601]